MHARPPGRDGAEATSAPQARHKRATSAALSLPCGRLLTLWAAFDAADYFNMVYTTACVDTAPAEYAFQALSGGATPPVRV
eukprot:6277686-Prymnesium_polylepis.1